MTSRRWFIGSLGSFVGAAVLGVRMATPALAPPAVSAFPLLRSNINVQPRVLTEEMMVDALDAMRRQALVQPWYFMNTEQLDTLLADVAGLKDPR